MTTANKLGLGGRKKPRIRRRIGVVDREIAEMWLAGAGVDTIVEAVGFRSSSAVYYYVKKLGLPGRRKRVAGAHGDARAGWRRCLRGGKQFWSPDRHRVQICPNCTRFNAKVYGPLADAGAVSSNGVGAGEHL